MIPASVEPCLDTVRNTSPGRPSSYSPMVTNPLQSATRNSNVRPRRLFGSFWRTGRWTTFSTTRSTTRSTAQPAAVSGGDRLGRRGEGLADLAVVAVDRHRLEAELPRQLVQRGDIVHGDLLGHVDGLADAAGQERLHRRHHPHVAFVVDRVVAHRAGEHGQVLGDEVGRPEDRLLGVDVSDDVGDLPLVVAEVGAGRVAPSVDDRHRAAADELLRLDQTEVRLDAGGVGSPS